MKAGSGPAWDPAGGAPGAVLFDLDGTLVHTAPDIATAVNSMLVDMGRPTHSTNRILEWVGEGAPRLVRRALADGKTKEPTAHELERGLRLFQQHYADGICVLSELYPHAAQSLSRLKEAGVGLGCVTNKPERLTRLLLEALGVAVDFDVVVGGDTLEHRKPRGEPILYACTRLRVDARDSVYIGDSMTDCAAAAAAGVPMVAVTYGYNRGADLTQGPCAAIIDGLDELIEILQRIRT